MPPIAAPRHRSNSQGLVSTTHHFRLLQTDVVGVAEKNGTANIYAILWDYKYGVSDCTSTLYLVLRISEKAHTDSALFVSVVLLFCY